MNNLETDEEINYPLPDPSWDYYEIWCDLHSAKTLIDKVIEHMQSIEFSDSNYDRLVRAVLQKTIQILKKHTPPDEPT